MSERKSNVDISIVVPVYNEEVVLIHTIEGLCSAVANDQSSYEFIFVDDGSHDKTWDKIVSQSLVDARIVGVRLSRNFGHDAALFSGFKVASGSAIVTMDCDGQHPFSEIPSLVKIWKGGAFDIVNCVKKKRGNEGKYR